MKESAVRAVVRRPGGPDVLELERTPRLIPGPGQVVIAMEAAGVAFGDVQLRQGLLPVRLPAVPGYDVVGHVIAIGAGVVDLAPGQRVAAFAGTGGYGTEVAVRAELCVPVPGDLPAAQVAALVLNYTTAWQLLHRAAQVRRGARVLVLGAAGGIGSALTELAVLDDVTVLGTASPARHRALAERGVVVVRDLDDPDALPERVDATFDPVGGPSLVRSRRLTAPDGVVVSYGASFGSTQGLSRSRLLASSMAALARAKLTPGPRVVLYVISTSVRRDPAGFRADLHHLIGLLQAGRIRPVVDTLPLDQVAEAHRRLENRQVIGKLVLTAAA